MASVQTATVLTRSGAMHLELPMPSDILLNEVLWGAVDAFPMPAYWWCQVMSRRLAGNPVQYKLGKSLAEEAGACLLGGHGIPAEVGVAAYERLRERGAFENRATSQAVLETWLREPLAIQQRPIRYRFAAQKAGFLAKVLPAVHEAPQFTSGRDLRDWLVALPGIGPKTASWIARNWMDADDVAILDIHIMRVGQLIGLFPRELTVERHYAALENLFVAFSAALDVRTSELDALVWYEMASSPTTARVVVEELRRTAQAPRPALRRARKRDPQFALIESN